MRDFTLKVHENGRAGPAILMAQFKSDERAKEYATLRLRDHPAIEAIEVWERETKIAAFDRPDDPDTGG
ncbi:MAG: hypothetical protein ABI906_09130 [Pseudomonadota bacterium]